MAKRPTLKDKQKGELVNKVTGWWKDVDTVGSNERDRDKLNREFYRGGEDGQWEAEIKQALEDQGKPALTINEILPTINFLLGTEAQAPKDIKTIHRKGGYEGVASVLTELIRHSMDDDDGHDIKWDCFAMALKGLVGWLKISVDKGEDPFTGDLAIEAPSARNVYVDPTCVSYDLNDPELGAKYIIERQWKDQEWIRAKYPDSSDDLQGEVAVGQTATGTELAEALADDLRGKEAEVDDEGNSLLKGKYRYDVQETWWHKIEDRTFVRNLETGDIEILNPKDKAEDATGTLVDLRKQNPDKFEVMEDVPSRILQKTVTVDKVLLKHIEDPYDGLWILPYFQFVPFFEDGHRFGVIDNLISPQRNTNKRFSQALHLVNQTANAGWLVRKLSKGYEKVLEMFGSKPGLVVDESKCGGKAERLQPNQLSTALVTLAELSKDHISEISGVNTAARGLEDTTEKAAIHFEGRRRTGLVVVEPVFKNFDKTVRLFGRGMIELIRRTDVYDRAEISRIVDEKSLVDKQHVLDAKQALAAQNPPPPRPDTAALLQMDEQERQIVMLEYEEKFAEYDQRITEEATELAKREVLKQLRDWSSGKYGVILTQSPATPSLRAERLAELVLISEKVPIPPRAWIEHTSLPSDVQEDIIEQIERAQAQVGAA